MRSIRNLRGIAIAAAILLAATACSGEEPSLTNEQAGTSTETEDGQPEDDQPDTEQPSDEESDAEQPDAATGDQVQARNINFEPADLTVTAGTTVTFTNEDIVRHTVTAGDPDDVGEEFDLALDAQGDTVTFTFDEPGTFEYFCRLHPAMRGSITVEG